MKKAKMKLLFELSRTLTALVLGTGGALTALLTSEKMATLPHVGFVIFGLLALLAVLGLALVFVFLLINKKIK